MLWNKVILSEVASGHTRDFKGKKFNCKKPILSTALKTISLFLLREKRKPNPTSCSGCWGCFSNQTSGEKLFSLLKDSNIFLASPTSNPRKRKIIIPALLIGKLENGKMPCATHFPTETGGNPWLPRMTEVAGQQHRGRKKKSQAHSAVSPFAFVATKPIPFSPFQCYSFMWYITGVSFGVCLFFPYFNISSVTIRSWVKSCTTGLNDCFVTKEEKCYGSQGDYPNSNRQQRSTKESKRERARVKTNKTDVSCIIWWVNHMDYGPRTT